MTRKDLVLELSKVICLREAALLLQSDGNVDPVETDVYDSERADRFVSVTQPLPTSPTFEQISQGDNSILPKMVRQLLEAGFTLPEIVRQLLESYEDLTPATIYQSIEREQHESTHF